MYMIAYVQEYPDLFDKSKLDSYFSGDNLGSTNKKVSVSRHTRIIRLAKLLLPSIAALLIGLLIVFPNLKKASDEISIDVTFPKKGELEKLHVENTVFYITDKNNNVNNFTAKNIDETEPGSKLIKLVEPDGVLPSKNGTWTNIKAPVGYFNQNTNILNLLDNVNIFYSDGMTAQTNEAFFDFKTSKGWGNKEVTSDGVFGTLNSQGFEFYSEKGLLIFTGKTYITVEEESLKENNHE